MSLWAIVPVKPLRRGKSRLAGVLTEEERTFLNYTMLANTLKAIKGAKEIDQILVASRDPAALAMARDFSARTFQEDGQTGGLVRALRQATVVAQMCGARSVLILPADLPLIDTPSIQAMINLAKKPPVVVIAPDRRKEGTNGLLLNPAKLIDYYYGLGSFQRHIQETAKYKNVRLEICDQPKLALDLDLPEDLDLLRHLDLVQFDLHAVD